MRTLAFASSASPGAGFEERYGSRPTISVLAAAAAAVNRSARNSSQARFSSRLARSWSAEPSRIGRFWDGRMARRAAAVGNFSSRPG